ncbi:MAG: formate dehydrogenase accessory sulfurtransferase FdhD [Nocardioidaceae bacterium]
MTTSSRPGPSVRTRVLEVTADGVRRHEDRLATEEPMEIRLAWPGHLDERVAVTMRTPGQDFELAVGFLHGEGLLDTADPGGAVSRVAYCTDADLTPEERYNVVTVALRTAPDHPPVARYAGPGGATSACGVCGTESIQEVLARTRVDSSGSWPDLRVDPEVLRALPEALRAGQRVFDATGGLHAAGLFDLDGNALVVREDVGRHNCVDKVVGARLLAGESPAVPVLCVSGRIGFEIVQKAVAARIGVLASVGAPSSLAVDLAGTAGLTTVGFVREGRFVVYSGSTRIGV